MTIESANKFREIVRGNTELQTTLRELTDGQGYLDLPATVNLAKQHGIFFSEDDIEAVLSNDNDELSDFELEMIAAGIPTQCKDTM